MRTARRPPPRRVAGFMALAGRLPRYVAPRRDLEGQKWTLRGGVP